MSPSTASGRLRAGLICSLLAAASFGMSGPFAKSLFEAGWSPGAAVAARLGIAATIMLIPGLLMMRGRWRALRRGGWLIVVYGIVAVAFCQFSFFNAVERMSPPIALMLEYLAPVLLVGWTWLRRRRAPGARTLVGAACAIVGLVLVLDVLGAGSVDPIGVLWGLAAAVCLMVYFLIAAHDHGEVPPLAVVSGGLLVGALTIGGLAVVGLLPMRVGFGNVSLLGGEVPWFVPVLVLAIVCAVLPYAFEMIASQRLGARLASFVGLTEVMFSVLASWALIGDVPRPIQIAGGVLIVAGVVLVRIDELRAGRAGGSPGLTETPSGMPPVPQMPVIHEMPVIPETSPPRGR